MGNQENNENGAKEDIFSKALRAGRRTYFFDVRETRAGDYYLTITESKKNQNNDGSFYYKKHKIYLYKEDFTEFLETLNETTDFIIDQKGEEVISERHQKDYVPEKSAENEEQSTEEVKPESNSVDSFTDVNFDEI